MVKKKNADESFCSSCGEVIKKEAEICPKCGVRQRNNSSLSSGRNKIVAGILGIFLGGIGAHKFYLGQIGMGILYLCFTWALIPWIVGLIEGIIYLSMSDAEFKAKYG